MVCSSTVTSTSNFNNNISDSNKGKLKYKIKSKNNKITNNKNKSENGWILNAKQIDFLRNSPYMYNCYVNSFLELLFLQKFWYKLSLLVPKWISPCVLTCTGLLINLLCTITILYYSPDSKQHAPWWSFFICAIGLFVYQIFDALDGKQAIKVQDTQIEEVYDHGCDAISAILVTQSVSIATNLGNYPFMQFSFFIVSMLAFFMTHFSCHITHVMVFGKVDVIEAQWAMILVNLITAIVGQDFWSSIHVYGQYKLIHLLWFFTIISLCRSIVTNLLLSLGYPTPLDKYIAIPRNKNLSRWNSFFILIFITICSYYCFREKVFLTNPLLFIVTFGLSCAKLTFNLQLMNVAKGELPICDTSMIGPLIIALNTYYSEVIDTNYCLIVAFIFSLVDHIRFFTMASLDMKRALQVDIFSLKYPPGHPKCRNKNYGFNMNGTENEKALKNIKNASHLLANYN